MTPEDPTALVLAGSRTAFVAHDDCRKRLKELPDNSVDAVVTDPPAGIAFMGKSWDRVQKEGMTELQAFQEFIFEVFTEVYRVLKPGGHAVVWALPRTAHHTTMGVERAGFEIRDVVHHLFGTGFPKSLDVSKALAKTGHDADWQGWGTALKPAAENWILARKPLIGTVVANVLEHGTGALNIDACRIAAKADDDIYAKNPNTAGGFGHADATVYGSSRGAPVYDPSNGRWPANFVLSHSDGCVQTGKEEVEAWDCVPECAVRMLDEQSGQRTSGVPGVGRREHETTSMAGKLGLTGKQETGYADSGGASRFFMTFSPDGGGESCGVALTEDESTFVGRKTESRDVSSLTDGSGKTPTDPSQQDMKSTISTMTPSTTTSQIFNSSQHLGTTTTTNDSAKTTRTSKGSNIGSASAALRTAPSTTTHKELTVPTKDTVDRAQGSTSKSGETRTGSTTTSTTAPTGSDNFDNNRFFYVAKAPGAEKSAVMTCGCTPKLKIKDIPVISMKEAKGQAGQPCPVCGEEQQLHAHPTVKSVSLMEWLVKLVTPPGGVVLDPFTGSGTTGVAARRLGFRFIGMEQDKVYCALARSRTN